MHGMSEHSARYARFAEQLTAAGYLVIASDHRGHGETTTEHGLQGHFADQNGFALVVEDLLCVRAELQALLVKHGAADVPIFVFGHSMGSFLAQWLLVFHSDKYRGFFLCASDAPGGLLVKSGHQLAKLERLRKGKRSTSRLLTFLSFGAFNKEFAPTRTESDWLSRDPAEVDAYVADHLCGFAVTTQLWCDLTAALIGIERRGFSGSRSAKVHLMSGSRDPVGKNGVGVQKLYEMLGGDGNANVSIKLYPDARHEILNETNRDEVMRDVATKLDAWM